ncbi:diguanylate cyclase domain-containing protein [Moritella sp. Urea-trap-13]|uniref:diguanylate cyclase domain-containing protein n=1 Tax=Moritella sp. Urea-trap-13 TaxID=2058327 RepID=UPI000C327B68|nr:diguanylate cyclase [Moritella sp. Urea-trap-13]PKH08046.1 diguanylate cyclase [Moritella sp. Urea-trap-13]
MKITQTHAIAFFSVIFMLMASISLFAVQKFQNSTTTLLASRTAEVIATTVNQARVSYSADIAQISSHPDITVETLYHDKPLSIPNPATFAIELGQAVSNRAAGLIIHTYSKYPFKSRTLTGGPQDQFQHDALAHLTTSSPVFERTEKLRGKPVLRHAEAIFMEQSCVDCHNHHPNSPKTDWQVGDIRGAIDVTVPLEGGNDDLAAIVRYSYIIFMAFSVISLLGMFITLKRTHQHSRELDKKVKIRTTILNEMAYTDSLTLIANRRSYEEFSDNIINQKCPNSLPLAIIIYDLDHFKQINDQYGHDIGDECLIAAVKAVSAILPKDNNFHARIGGEEFAIILKHVSNDELEQIIQRVLESVRKVKIPKQADIKITCSIGATLATELNEPTIKNIVKTADDALYEAKSLGRDQWINKPYAVSKKL